MDVMRGMGKQAIARLQWSFGVDHNAFNASKITRVQLLEKHAESPNDCSLMLV